MCFVVPCLTVSHLMSPWFFSSSDMSMTDCLSYLAFELISNSADAERKAYFLDPTANIDGPRNEMHYCPHVSER